MADAGVRRHDREVVKRRLTPPQKRVALAVALELELGVAPKREALAEHVDLDRVVDDQLDRDERVDLRGVAAELRDRVAHRGEVDDRRDVGEVLHEHAARGERDLRRRLGRRIPSGERLDVAGRDLLAALGPQQVLEQDLQRVRQPPNRCASASRRKISSARPPISRLRARRKSRDAGPPSRLDLPARTRSRVPRSLMPDPATSRQVDERLHELYESHLSVEQTDVAAFYDPARGSYPRSSPGRSVTASASLSRPRTASCMRWATTARPSRCSRSRRCSPTAWRWRTMDATMADDAGTEQGGGRERPPRPQPAVRAVERSLAADVPVEILLSGGLPRRS